MTAPARTFPGHWLVRLGDATGSGRIRLDALARYLQDVATDDATDAGLADGWVLRRVALQIDAFPRFRDAVDLVTWCSGVAGSAAERCTTVRVDGRLVVDAVALWVFVGPDGRPTRLDRDRFAIYGTAATGRRIPTRLRHADPPPGAAARPWPLRATDVDVLRHVNNAVSLAAVEDLLRDLGVDDAPAPWTVEVEYRAAIEPGDAPDLVWAVDPSGALVGGLCCHGVARTTFRVVLPGLSLGGS